MENNYLSAKEAEKKTALERKEKDGTLTADEAKELADTRQLDKDRDQAIRDICTQGNKSGGACSALVAQAQQALNSYGESAASYRLIFKDLYPQDAANASAILKGLDEGSITRDAAITAIAKATGKGWDDVASQYDSVMTAHAITVALAGVYGMKPTVPDSKGITPALESGEYSAIKPGPLKPSMAETFSGGRYQEKIFTEDTILYRAGVSDTPFGQYFSFEKPTSVIQTRIDKAVLPVWPTGDKSPIDTTFGIKIPAGTKYYVGEVGSQSGFYVGGTQQVVIPTPWKLPGVEVISKEPLK